MLPQNRKKNQKKKDIKILEESDHVASIILSGYRYGS